MKSLLISRYFPPYAGGISQFMGSVASALGPDRVCCLTNTPANGSGPNAGVSARVYRRPRVFEGPTPLQAVSWAATVAEIMLRERPRAVQIAMAGEGYLGLWLRRWLGLPFLVYAHGNEVLDAMRSTWDKPRLALRQADRVLANSQFTASLVEQAGVRAKRIAVVHPGCDSEFFRPLPADLNLKRRLLGDRTGDRVLLTVGGLVAARKGADMVIRALPRVLTSCPNVTYLVVGSGRARQTELEALAFQAGIRDHVVFFHDAATAELPGIYALADVFVMPSREHLEGCDVEGFGIVYLEAGACRKPVVGGRSGGIPEAIVDGVTGLLVNPHDPEDIASALICLLNDRSLATRLGEQGRSRVVRDFSWTRVAGQVQEVLDSILRGESI